MLQYSLFLYTTPTLLAKSTKHHPYELRPLYPPHLITMKFRDGMWLPSQHFLTAYAEEVHDVQHKKGGDAITLLCPTKRIASREGTLNSRLLTMVCHQREWL